MDYNSNITLDTAPLGASTIQSVYGRTLRRHNKPSLCSSRWPSERALLPNHFARRRAAKSEIFLDILQDNLRDRLQRECCDIIDLLTEVRAKTPALDDLSYFEFIRPERCPRVFADRQRVICAIQSLLEFIMHAAGPRDRVSLWAEPYCDEMVCIGLGHSGRGLKAIEQRYVFEPRGLGGQLRASDVRCGPFVARQVALAHQGDLWMRNHEKLGTTFYFWLPVYTPPSA